jgi:hypothetical protein
MGSSIQPVTPGATRRCASRVPIRSAKAPFGARWPRRPPGERIHEALDRREDGRRVLALEHRGDVGGWPYDRNKDEIPDPGWSGHAREGSYLPRFAWTDQFGDPVDIYDFAEHGKPIMLDLSGLWCGWCHEVANFIDGDGNTVFDGAAYAKYAGLPDMVASGDVYWITVVDSDYQSQPAVADDGIEWYNQHKNGMVPVLVDEDQQLTGWYNPSGYPTMALLDDQLKVISFDKGNYQAQWDALLVVAGDQ